MSELSKEQLLKSLYTIRAGLSQVSGKKGQSEKLSKKVNSLTEQRNKDEAELGYLKQRYKQNKKDLIDIDSRKKELETTIDNLKSKLRSAPSGKTKKRPPELTGPVGGTIMLLLIVFNVVILVMSALNDWSAIPLLISLGCSVVFLFVACGVVAAIDEKNKKTFDENEKKTKEEDSKLRCKLSDAESQLERLNSIPEKVARCEELQEKLATPPAGLLETKEELKACKTDAVVIYTVLEDTYSSLLDVRDWGNLDLLIYYLETNRADNIKEALHCLDEQMRHTEIMTLMAMATKEICSTISSWNARMSFQLDNIAANQRTIAAGIDASNTNLSNLLSATNMQNALLEKQNVSSRQLMDDVSALRQHSDHLRYTGARF